MSWCRIGQQFSTFSLYDDAGGDDDDDEVAADTEVCSWVSDIARSLETMSASVSHVVNAV